MFFHKEWNKVYIIPLKHQTQNKLLVIPINKHVGVEQCMI